MLLLQTYSITIFSTLPINPQASLSPSRCWKNSWQHSKSSHPATDTPNLVQVLWAPWPPNSLSPTQGHPSYNQAQPGNFPSQDSIPCPYPISLRGASLLLQCTDTSPSDPSPTHRDSHHSC